MTDMVTRVAEIMQKYDEGMALIGGCGDGGCLVAKPAGMRTNGGCRCWQDRMKAQRSMARGKWLADQIHTALNEHADKSSLRGEEGEKA